MPNRTTLTTPFFSQNTYRALFGLLGVVYIIGLFVPLMDNDSAHHADIALRMHLTGDYVRLIDADAPYLDKPHLHFWLAAWSYKIFGVTAFAYKLPSFLFTIMGTYATYRLGKSLYSAEVGKLAALMAASAAAYMLANTDVRMDAILTASVALATWQLVDWVKEKKSIHALGAALGLALGFCTKGHIGVVTPAAAAFFYILYRKDWKSFYHPQLLVMIAAFAFFISPVVYCYYLQYDMHPETVVRGRNNISGVKFILWQQNFERFQGDSFGSDGKNDYFFFFHSYLWAFAPWSVLAYIALFRRIKNLKSRSWEWLTIGTIAVIALLTTFSGFKLPHYLNIIFPASAVLVASFIAQLQTEGKRIKPYAVLQTVLCILLLLAAAALNVWAFPVYNMMVVAGFLLLVALAYWLLKNERGRWQRLVAGPVLTMACVFYLMNANFYPQLLTYQGGGELAKIVNRDIGAENVYEEEGIQSFSLNFYTATLARTFNDSLLEAGKPVWVLVERSNMHHWTARYKTGKIIRHRDFSITQLTGRFINPATRRSVLTELILVEILGKK